MWTLVVVLLLGWTGTSVGQPQCPVSNPLPDANGYAFGKLTSAALGIPELSTRLGYYRFELSEATGNLRVYVFAAGLNSTVQSVTLNCYANGTGACTPGNGNCPVCVNLSALANSTALPLDVSTVVSQAVVQQLRAGNAYLLVTTTTYPSGELRGYGQDVCSYAANVRYNTTSALAALPNVASAAACCAACQSDWWCQTFAWLRNGTCYKKDSAAQVGPTDTNYTSGRAPAQVYFYVVNDWLAQLTSPTSSYRAMALFSTISRSQGTYRVHVLHTIPDALLPAAAALVAQSPTGAPTTLVPLRGSSNTQFANVTLTADQQAALLTFSLALTIQSNVNANTLSGILLPTTISPITAAAPGTLSGAVFPKDRRGADGGSVTVAVNFNSSNVGNEIWVTLPPDFEYNSGGATNVTFPIGVAAPTDVVVLPSSPSQVQLRWRNSSRVPFINGTFVAFTLTNVALPNNCDPKPWRLQTAYCYVDNFLSAGVLYYRKCAPNATDVDVRLPSGAAPTGCRPDGCNACKLLYVNNQTNDLVYSCEHQGQVFFRTNVSGCLACGSTVAYSVNV
eukprot:EG_transcript_7518